MFLGVFIHPNVATSITVPAKRDPLLFSHLRIFVTIGSHKFQATVRTELVEWGIVRFPTDRINKRIRCHRVGMGANRAMPSNRYPTSLSLVNTILVEANCYRSACWAFLSYCAITIPSVHHLPRYQRDTRIFYLFYKCGSSRENVLPFLRVLFTQIFPLCFSTICLQIKRPRPVPSWRRSSAV